MTSQDKIPPTLLLLTFSKTTKKEAAPSLTERHASLSPLALRSRRSVAHPHVSKRSEKVAAS